MQAKRIEGKRILLKAYGSLEWIGKSGMIPTLYLQEVRVHDRRKTDEDGGWRKGPSVGLNDEVYANIRGQTLAIEPLPSLDKIFNMVHQEESHKRLMINRDDLMESVAAFAVFGKTTVSEKGPCTHCRKFGHEETGCF